MALIDRQWFFLRCLAKLIDFAEAQGYTLSGGELYRPQEMQDIYYARKLTRTKHSKHTDRLAIDVHVFLDGKYQTGKEGYDKLGAYWTSLDPTCIWGGNFRTLKDYNHFEVMI